MRRRGKRERRRGGRVGRTDGRTDGWRKQGGRKGIIEFRATSERRGGGVVRTSGDSISVAPEAEEFISHVGELQNFIHILLRAGGQARVTVLAENEGRERRDKFDCIATWRKIVAALPTHLLSFSTVDTEEKRINASSPTGNSQT